MANDPLRPEEYTEPVCPLDMEPSIAPVNQGRILEKLDGYLARKDYAAAERHLKYWLPKVSAVMISIISFWASSPAAMPLGKSWRSKASI